MSSEFGNKIKLSIFGESHGEAIGCVIDSIPAGVKLDMEKIYFDMARRAPGKDKTATPRLEKDIPHILSGVLNGVNASSSAASLKSGARRSTSRMSAVPRLPAFFTSSSRSASAVSSENAQPIATNRFAFSGKIIWSSLRFSVSMNRARSSDR